MNNRFLATRRFTWIPTEPNLSENDDSGDSGSEGGGGAGKWPRQMMGGK